MPRWKSLYRKVVCSIIVTSFICWLHLSSSSTLQIPPNVKLHRKIQYDFRYNRMRAHGNRRNEVKEEFQHNWWRYEERPWVDRRQTVDSINRHTCIWVTTIIDALNALLIFEMNEELNDALLGISSLNYTATHRSCAFSFETTARHLGGFLSAYDLIASGTDSFELDQQGLRSNQDALEDTKVATLLYHRSVEIGDFLLKHVAAMKHSQRTSTSDTTTPQELDAFEHLSLEFTRLSQITSDKRYHNEISRMASVVASSQDLSPIPGLWKARTEEQNDGYSVQQIGAAIYESILKSHVQSAGSPLLYGEMWQKAEATFDNMLLKPMTPEKHDILFAGTAAVSNGSLSVIPTTTNLACSLGGLMAFSAAAFGRTTDLETARRLTNGCVWAYWSTNSRVMPESFSFIPCKNRGGTCLWSSYIWSVYASKAKPEIFPVGFAYVEDPRYLLRPSAISSILTLFRVTATPTWREAGWKLFTSIRGNTHVASGHSALQNVLNPLPGNLEDDRDGMYRLWMIETLKYFYLIFADPDLLDLNEWIFTSRGHPLRIQEIDARRAE